MGESRNEPDELVALRALVQAAPDPMGVVDGKGRMLFANPATGGLAQGGTPATLAELVAPADRKDLPAHLARAATSDEPLHVPLRFLADAGPAPRRVTLGRASTNGDRLVAWTAPAPAADEPVLRDLAAIGESATLLAHEIRNPLTSVNLALRATAGRLGQDEREALEQLAGRLEELEDRLQRTLSLARPLRLTPETVPVRELLDATRALVGEELDAREVELDAREEGDCPPLRADRALVRDALVNLVRNACAAVGRGGRIRIRAYAEGPSVTIRIDDDGPGLDPDLAERAFQPFVTGGGGAGLGLALARKVAREHGGELVASPRGPLGGASFRLSLPTRSDAPQ